MYGALCKLKQSHAHKTTFDPIFHKLNFESVAPMQLKPPILEITPHYLYNKVNDKYRYVIVGVISKCFMKTNLLSAISYKEIYALCATVLYFAPWIRNNCKYCVCWADIQFLQFILRMKSTSTRLHSISIFLPLPHYGQCISYDVFVPDGPHS